MPTMHMSATEQTTEWQTIVSPKYVAEYLKVSRLNAVQNGNNENPMIVSFLTCVLKHIVLWIASEGY